MIDDRTNAAAIPNTPYQIPNNIIVGTKTSVDTIVTIRSTLLFSNAKNLEV